MTHKFYHSHKQSNLTQLLTQSHSDNLHALYTTDTRLYKITHKTAVSIDCKLVNNLNATNITNQKEIINNINSIFKIKSNKAIAINQSIVYISIIGNLINSVNQYDKPITKITLDNKYTQAVSFTTNSLVYFKDTFMIQDNHKKSSNTLLRESNNQYSSNTAIPNVQQHIYIKTKELIYIMKLFNEQKEIIINFKDNHSEVLFTNSDDTIQVATIPFKVY